MYPIKIIPLKLYRLLLVNILSISVAVLLVTRVGLVMKRVKTCEYMTSKKSAVCIWFGTFIKLALKCPSR